MKQRGKGSDSYRRKEKRDIDIDGISGRRKEIKGN
jgi:hypothetical protein